MGPGSCLIYSSVANLPKLITTTAPVLYMNKLCIFLCVFDTILELIVLDIAAIHLCICKLHFEQFSNFVSNVSSEQVLVSYDLSCYLSLSQEFAGHGFRKIVNNIANALQLTLRGTDPLRVSFY